MKQHLRIGKVTSLTNVRYNVNFVVDFSGSCVGPTGVLYIIARTADK